MDFVIMAVLACSLRPMNASELTMAYQRVGFERKSAVRSVTHLRLHANNLVFWASAVAVMLYVFVINHLRAATSGRVATLSSLAKGASASVVLCDAQ